MSRRIRAISPGIWLISGIAVWLATLVSVRAFPAENPAALQTTAETQKPQPP